MKPTLISLFSGIGGLDLAAHWAGFETIRFVEKEPFCQKVLAKHWPNVPIDDDVFTSHPEHADVVCGGFPCQPFSSAGKQLGEKDERYLLPEMLRIVSEVNPYAVVFENVSKFPTFDNGTSFKYLLRSLTEMGFDAQWGNLFAKDVGAGHSRERWFLVAYSESNGSQRNSGTMGNTQKTTRQKNDGKILNGSGEVLEYTNALRLQEFCAFTSGSEKRQFAGRFIANGRNWLSKSRLGRTAYGLPRRLDFVGFPAHPSEPQHAYEPPRTAPSTKETNARIKALGNAVVPQVAYPIFAAIKEWLDSEEQLRLHD